jgi:transposase
MLVVETIARIRREHFVKGKGIKAIVRDLRVSRKVVRKVLRSGATEFSYERQEQPHPKLGPFIGRLEAMLVENGCRSRRERLTLKRLFDLLRREGYAGGYDAVRRFAGRWRREQRGAGGAAYVPLIFPPGDAYQFDWSHELVELGGMPMTVKVAHVRLCHSRAFYLRAYPRETQEMVFDAHARAFAFFGGTCRRGIYDNMSTAVDTVFLGKERLFNRRFLQLCSHYLVEPVACTPAAGWEKGQVENQVGFARDNIFKPRLRFKTLEELNGWLEAECRRFAETHRHPELRERTVAEVLEAERQALVPVGTPFDGGREVEAVASSTCLVSFDRNRYSVAAVAARRPVQVRVYADRLVIRCDGRVVGEHARRFGRDHTAFDPWHYLPILVRKPGALRNGAPFRDWSLPPALARTRRRLGSGDQADRQFVTILAAVPTEGLDAVSTACEEALAGGSVSADVVLNILARQRVPAQIESVAPPAELALTTVPVADCARYDRLRPSHVAEDSRAAS